MVQKSKQLVSLVQRHIWRQNVWLFYIIFFFRFFFFFFYWVKKCCWFFDFHDRFQSVLNSFSRFGLKFEFSTLTNSISKLKHWTEDYYGWNNKMKFCAYRIKWLWDKRRKLVESFFIRSCGSRQSRKKVAQLRFFSLKAFSCYWFGFLAPMAVHLYLLIQLNTKWSWKYRKNKKKKTR